MDVARQVERITQTAKHVRVLMIGGVASGLVQVLVTAASKASDGWYVNFRPFTRTTFALPHCPQTSLGTHGMHDASVSSCAACLGWDTSRCGRFYAYITTSGTWH